MFYVSRGTDIRFFNRVTCLLSDSLPDDGDNDNYPLRRRRTPSIRDDVDGHPSVTSSTESPRGLTSLTVPRELMSGKTESFREIVDCVPLQHLAGQQRRSSTLDSDDCSQEVAEVSSL
jgi:hypothetical protein